MSKIPITPSASSLLSADSEEKSGENAILAQIQAGYEQHQAGNVDDAIAQYLHILEEDPENPDALYLAGVAYFQIQDFEQAELFLEAALSLAPGRSDILINLGNCQHAQSRLDEALEAYTQAISADPSIAEAHNNQGNVLRELGRFEEAEAAFRQALTLQTDYLSAQCNLAATFRSLGKLEAAESLTRKILEQDPTLDMALTVLGCTLLDQGRPDEAIAALEQAIELNPNDRATYISLAKIWRRKGQIEEALQICDSYLRLDPRDTMVLSVKALLLNEQGGAENAKSLLDFERFILPLKFNNAPNYNSISSFHEALREHAERHPDLLFEPVLKSTRKGFQAEQLERDDALPIEALKDIIAQGVEQYCANCENLPGHPLAPPPEDLSITIWVTILEANGYQHPHIHPSAWLSGVYYVALPERMKDNPKSQAGWIEFGRPRDEEKYQASPLLHKIEPQEGLMVLFPSYTFHRTIPVADGADTGSVESGIKDTGIEEKRISIAFDVLAG
jgi:tetratricopeptide (TPR) repeat protein